MCWYESAVDDGIACESSSTCLSGECDTDRGLCTCSSHWDCFDGEDHQGACVTELGVCGPAWCNGYLICSNWGGCVWWHGNEDYTPDDWVADLDAGVPYACCEGNYPAADDGQGSGYATVCE